MEGRSGLLCSSPLDLGPNNCSQARVAALLTEELSTSFLIEERVKSTHALLNLRLVGLINGKVRNPLILKLGLTHLVQRRRLEIGYDDGTTCNRVSEALQDDINTAVGHRRPPPVALEFAVPYAPPLK